METQTNTTSQENAENTPAAEAGLGDRFRTRAKEVRAQLDAAETRAKERWAEMPGKLRGALYQAVDRVRAGLDLPSRREVTSLSERLDLLDKKLTEYEQTTGRGQPGPGDGAPSA